MLLNKTKSLLLASRDLFRFAFQVTCNGKTDSVPNRTGKWMAGYVQKVEPLYLVTQKALDRS